MKKIIVLQWVVLMLLSLYSKAQESSEEDKVPDTKFKQQPGLAKAASKIFYSEKPWSVSGFGEISMVNRNDVPLGMEDDIELSYNNLYRFSTFFGYRFTDKIIWNSEILVEYLKDPNGNDHFEFIVEAFLDFSIHNSFNVRTGLYPLSIGYINNNDEPVMFSSVNRSDVERIIIPSTWMGLGVSFYGGITNDLNYTLGFAQGLDGSSLQSGTFIRSGREPRFDSNAFSTFSVNPQLNFTGIENWTLSASAYVGQAGNNMEFTNSNGTIQTANAVAQLYSTYIKYTQKNWEFMALATTGYMSGTDDLYHITKEGSGGVGQVIANQNVGYLVETSYDLLSLFSNRSFLRKKNFMIDPHDVKIPIFIRYEYIDTHKNYNQKLLEEDNVNMVHFNSDIITIGVNFKPREEIAFKIDYQFRNNRATGPYAAQEDNLLELGIGFIF
ncbi:porin [Flammeovirga kamogawensis]|uniref:Porin n=1 Tax=Flammeovirga kamogawensis TaxID=373891 RepID=A0ABX8GVG4_9BACT|nr:porin [Flammeovirga kamogawensis]MBB6461018.1 hypothetical protein [Flammeovirga kamogawensis]QWG07588.1 hypothetical protein KM029_01220 [Flammeovirga kamogawensis]TRX69400.1 porin [Flammeovirga kamogawensis]